MNNNSKVLSFLVGALLSFVVAALFQFVFHWGVGVFVTLSALSLLYCATETQTVETYMPSPLRIVLAVVGFALTGVFGLIFMSWTLLAIYLVAFVAVTIAAIVRA